jgi:hypothetical protein
VHDSGLRDQTAARTRASGCMRRGCCPCLADSAGSISRHAWRLFARPDRIGQRAAVSLLLGGLRCVHRDHDKVGFVWTLTGPYSSTTASSDKRTEPGHRIANRGQRPEAACTLPRMHKARGAASYGGTGDRAYSRALASCRERRSGAERAPTHAKQICSYPRPHVAKRNSG